MQTKNTRYRVPAFLWTFACGLVLTALAAMPARLHAADRADVDRFLRVTGFDIALESIALGAENAPEMLGQDPGDFGIIWQRMVEDVMRPDEIVDLAADLLERTLDQSLLDHALDFYGSELGQKVVEIENAAHQEADDGAKAEAGQAIVAALVRAGTEGRDRLEYFRRMNAAVDSEGLALKATVEIQIRFLMAAAAHGVIALQMDEADMRELFRQQEAKNRAALMASAMANAAYTYQALGDDELGLYTQALETPRMQELYNLMNAIHFEITATKFEELAERMASLRPSQDL